MMINYVHGDLLQAKVDAIAHGCNCQKKMGKGIAKLIAQKWPEVRKADLELDWSPEKKLGEIYCVRLTTVTNNLAIKYVVNCYTQVYYGYGMQIDYDAITTCMELLRDFTFDYQMTVAIPKIGAGLGGGDWPKIEGIINSVFGKQEIFVYIWP